MLRGLEERAQVAIDHRRSALVTKCRGGGAHAFELALDKLRECEAVAVGGIDSYFDPDLLEYLDRELRLHGLECENGFLPGEGAGFVVLTSRSAALTAGSASF